MRPQANFTRQLAFIAAFAASCVLILVYLWTSFGGSIPLKPKSYRVSVDFPEASNLTLNADVRISGVTVGHVVAKNATSDGTTHTVLELEPRYAPLPANARAMLRQKTIVGEIYVDLTPGNPSGPKLPEGGTIPRAQISPSVELDEIFRAFDPKTRAAFRTWFESHAAGVRGRGRDLNDAIGNTPTFARDTDQLLKILNSQDGAVQQVVRNTGEVFDALSERRGQLRGAITNWNTVLRTTASRNKEIEGTFKALPTFAREGSAAMQRLAAFSKRANPVVTQLRPAARQLGPALQDVNAISPDFEALMRGIGPLADASKQGMPDARRFLGELRGVLGAFPPVLTQLNPFFGYLGAHKEDFAAFIVNVTAATQASSVPAGVDHAVHYLRAMTPLGPGAISQYPDRQGWARSNPYPLTAMSSKSGFEVYDSRSCSDTGWPTIAKTRVEGVSLDFLDRIERFALNSGVRATPPCVQEKRGSTPGFQHLLPSHP
jgi:virulence factor Mce-like protein